MSKVVRDCVIDDFLKPRHGIKRKYKLYSSVDRDREREKKPKRDRKKEQLGFKKVREREMD